MPEPPTKTIGDRPQRWRTARRHDLAHLADLLTALAFCAVLVAPLHSLPRLCSYALALLTLCRPAVWHSARAAPLAWLTALLLGYLLLTMSWSGTVEPALGVRFGIRALVVVCFVVAFADCVRRGDAHRRVGRWFALASGGAACFAIADFILRPPEMGRLLGPGQIQNELIAAQAFTVGTLFALNALLRGGGAARPAWMLLFATSALATTAAVGLTGARTGWVALIVGVGVLWLAHRAPARFWQAAALWVVLLAAVVGALAWHEATRDWLAPRGTSFRTLIWERTVAHTLAHAPWFGNGLLADNNLAAADRTFLHPHSVYLSIFHQGGAVGLTLFAALFGVTAIVLARRLDNPDAGLALALLSAGAVVALLDGHQLIHKVGVVWWLFWLPVATAIAVGPTNPTPTRRGTGRLVTRLLRRASATLLRADRA